MQHGPAKQSGRQGSSAAVNRRCNVIAGQMHLRQWANELYMSCGITTSASSLRRVYTLTCDADASLRNQSPAASCKNAALNC
jgi:hypothetical protein